VLIRRLLRHIASDAAREFDQLTFLDTYRRQLLPDTPSPLAAGLDDSLPQIIADQQQYALALERVLLPLRATGVVLPEKPVASAPPVPTSTLMPRSSASYQGAEPLLPPSGAEFTALLTEIHMAILQLGALAARQRRDRLRLLSAQLRDLEMLGHLPN
jgi:hypothetical protein